MTKLKNQRFLRPDMLKLNRHHYQANKAQYDHHQQFVKLSSQATHQLNLATGEVTPIKPEKVN